MVLNQYPEIDVDFYSVNLPVRLQLTDDLQQQLGCTVMLATSKGESSLPCVFRILLKFKE